MNTHGSENQFCDVINFENVNFNLLPHHSSNLTSLPQSSIKGKVIIYLWHGLEIRKIIQPSNNEFSGFLVNAFCN